jgi:hypothetical protein
MVKHGLEGQYTDSSSQCMKFYNNAGKMNRPGRTITDGLMVFGNGTMKTDHYSGKKSISRDNVTELIPNIR